MVITLGREFGSGGRELGRRLADHLKIAYYDKEILTEIAKRTQLTEEYVHNVVEHHPYPLLPITIGHSLYPDMTFQIQQSVYAEQSNIIKEMAAASDCIIVGRCADYILRDIKPFRIFVYADMESRIISKGEFFIIGFQKVITLQFSGENQQIESLQELMTEERKARLLAMNDTEPKGIISVSADFSDRTREGSTLKQYLGIASSSGTADGFDVLHVPASCWAVFPACGRYPSGWGGTCR